MIPALQVDRAFFVQRGFSPSSVLEAFQLQGEKIWLDAGSPITGFEQFIYRLQRADPPQLGTFYLYYLMIAPIPRLIWPGKPLPLEFSSMVLGHTFWADPAFWTSTNGSIGEAYRQWGWFGIPFEFFLTGFLIRTAEEWRKRRGTSSAVLLAYAGIYAMITQTSRDSIFYLGSAWAFQWLLPALIIAFGERVLKSRREQSARSQEPPMATSRIGTPS